MTATAKNYDSFIFSTSGIIVPMSLISGTYFSLNQTPEFIKVLAQLLPLTHAVSLTRTIMYKNYNWNTIALDVGVLLIYFLVCLFIARRLFAKKLVL
jgi:lipooligosaccharide transport system permease protein